MDSAPRPSRSNELTFDDFKRLAADPTLNSYEKIGFPRSYREGQEERIFDDIVRKLPGLNKTAQTIIEIGPGSSGPAFAMIQLGEARNHCLILIDSGEMLSRVPDAPQVVKIVGRFPDQSRPALQQYVGKVDVIVCYSVLHYIFNETNLFDFLDSSIELLAEGGQMLIGDIPNVSKRRRFFSSSAGKAFHRQFTGTDGDPAVAFNEPAFGKIDDSVLLALLLRARNAGCDSYVVPQPSELPMANRREDLLILKP